MYEFSQCVILKQVGSGFLREKESIFFCSEEQYEPMSKRKICTDSRACEEKISMCGSISEHEEAEGYSS